jgi:hypothetical protein
MLSKVLPEDWDAPEHLSLPERDFLVTRAEAIHGIVAKSYLDTGRVLLQVKKKFKRDPNLDGWFKRWCDECLPFSYSKCHSLVKIAEEAEENPEIIALTDSTPQTTLYKVLCLPTNAKASVIEEMTNGTMYTGAEVDNIAALPEVQVEKFQELVDHIEQTVLNGKLRGDPQKTVDHNQRRLNKAILQLQEAEKKVESLGKSNASQEVLVTQLKQQLRQHEVQIEEINLDPEQKRKRALAKTVVDATTSLDLLLSALDRYGTDKPELGVEAIKTIERKLQQVQTRLLEHYGATKT